MKTLTIGKSSKKILSSILSAAILLSSSGLVRAQLIPGEISGGNVNPVAETANASHVAVVPQGVGGSASISASGLTTPETLDIAIRTSNPIDASAPTSVAIGEYHRGIRIIPSNEPLAAFEAASPILLPASNGSAGQNISASVGEFPTAKTWIGRLFSRVRPSAIFKSPAYIALQQQTSAGSRVAVETFGNSVNGQGFLPSAPRTIHGLTLDSDPTFKAGTEGAQSWKASLPLVAARGPIRRLAESIFGSPTSQTQPISLPGNPQDEAGVEKALRELINANSAALFKGLASEDFTTVRVKKVPGKAGVPDSIIAEFIQQIDNLYVQKSYLHFTVKLGDGQSSIVYSEANFYPELKTSLNTKGTLNRSQIEGKALERLGIPTNNASELSNWDKQIAFVNGQWRVLQMYVTSKKSIMVVVDVNTGETFAWDMRRTLRPSTAGTKDSNGAFGRGIKDGPNVNEAVLTELPLGHLKIENLTQPGKDSYTAIDGSFTVPGERDKVQLKVRLSGKYFEVHNQAGKDLEFTLEAVPGQTLRVVFNPKGMDEQATADVHGYYFPTLTVDRLIADGVNVFENVAPLQVHTNVDDDCNAYFDEVSLNFFKASSRCVNSSYSDVNPHETGHYADFLAHMRTIPNGGLSEAWGDILVMILTQQPIIGRGFLIGRNPSYIRTGENNYQYNPADQVHQQGEAFMGFFWKLRKSLINSLGEEKGAALAEALTVPVLLVTAEDIPSAIHHTLLRDTDSSGYAPHFKEIQAAAKAHGIDIKKSNGGMHWPEFWSQMSGRPISRSPIKVLAANISRMAQWLSESFSGGYPTTIDAPTELSPRAMAPLNLEKDPADPANLSWAFAPTIGSAGKRDFRWGLIWRRSQWKQALIDIGVSPAFISASVVTATQFDSSIEYAVEIRSKHGFGGERKFLIVRSDPKNGTFQIIPAKSIASSLRVPSNEKNHERYLQKQLNQAHDDKWFILKQIRPMSTSPNDYTITGFVPSGVDGAIFSKGPDTD